MKTVSAKYARQNFAEILNEVHFTGEKILITKSGKPMVIVSSTKEYRTKKRNK
jgi:prevent-host-death family protein